MKISIAFIILTSVISVFQCATNYSRGLYREVFFNMQATIDNLRSLLIYPKISSYGEKINLIEAHLSQSFYCQRIRGWFVPSQNGNHTFYTSCDDICQLYLSDDNDPSNARLIVSQTIWTGRNSWYSYPSMQTSKLIPLKSNYSYYIELVMFNSNTPDGLSVALKMPNNIMKAPLPNEFLGYIKLCSSGSRDSTNVEKCLNINSSYAVCTCQNGYYPLNDQCSDINECLSSCNFANSVCVNFDGGYNCSCKTFWQIANDNLSCIDINECTAGTHTCFGEQISCVNRLNGYNCTCDNDCWVLKSDFQEQRCEERNTTDAKCLPKLNVNVLGSINRNLITLKSEIIYYNNSLVPAHDITIEYLLPLYISHSSDLVSSGFTWLKEFKYLLKGAFNFTSSISHAINASIHYDLCPNNEMAIEVPVKVTFKSFGGKIWSIFKTYRNTVKFKKKSLIVNKDSSAISERYGRGIYWDNNKSHIYVCMSQHMPSTTVACYHSNNNGYLWDNLDAQVGSILGHHKITNELYAIHRNCKTYIMFHNIHKKWLALTVQQFNEMASHKIDPAWRKNLEGDYEQVYTLGPNDWLGNAEGLFYRKHGETSWIQRVKWVW